ncbi:MAG: Gfo/Idh/MocA family oxidoreductase [Planctomycetes bacterium]|nr:Gfo/Idh/MocA family oxidoreductase [Planctomycetota bacterium]
MRTGVDTRRAGRRDFLKATTAAGIGAAARLTIARSAHAAGNDTIRIGMVGCGGRCSGAAVDAMTADPGTRLVAMSDLFADRVQSKRQLLKTTKPEQVAVDDDHCFEGLDGYRHVIDSVDVVLVACAAKFHPMYLKAAVDAGKHVFVEKPHAIDPSGIKVVVAACEAAKQKNIGVMSGLQSRYDGAIRETIERVHDGRIGEIIAIEENFIRGPYGNIARPPGMRELEVQYGNQYRFSWLCGDDVTQSLVHNVDRATWALNGETPVDCHGMGGRSGVQNLLGDVFDHHAVVYRYASGARVYAFCRTTPNCYNESSSIILGSKGIAYPLGGRITGPNEWKYSGPGGSPYVAEHDAFFRSIRAGTPLNCGDYMARSTLVVIMGQLSCYSGRELRWDEVTASDFCLAPKPEECTWEMEPPTKPDAQGIYPVCAMPGVTTNV